MKKSKIIQITILYAILLMMPALVMAQDSVIQAEPEKPTVESGTAVTSNIADEANKAYQEGDYNKAIEILEAEMKVQKAKGLESANLYYNLGNAYFRDNEVAKALLYYEKALLIDPADRDTRHNIEYARTRIEDKIVGVDTFFLQSWFDAVQNLLSSNVWAKISIALFLAFMLSLCFFFFTHRIAIKKTAFYAGIVLLSLLIFSNVFSIRQKYKLTHRNTAIVMAGSVSVKNSPDSSSKELFIIHSGTKVKINKEDGRWLEIEIENGNVGWMTRDQLEII